MRPRQLPPPRDFAGALRRQVDSWATAAVIAEIKKASPSKGVLRDRFPARQTSLQAMRATWRSLPVSAH